MTPVHTAAVRAFQRAWAPIASELLKAARVGEGDGTVHADKLIAAFRECLTRVASRFELAADTLLADLNRADSEERQWRLEGRDRE